MDVGTGGAEGAAAPPTFGMGEQAIVLALPKVGAILHCDESNRLRHRSAEGTN